MSKTLYDKIWDDHLVNEQQDGTSLLHVDRHLIHEVTSPKLLKDCVFIKEEVSQHLLWLSDTMFQQVIEQKELEQTIKVTSRHVRNNCKEFGIRYLALARKTRHKDSGPEQGFTQPGTVMFAEIVIRLLTEPLVL